MRAAHRTFGKCPLCGHEALVDFYFKTGVPVTCTSVCDSAAEALRIPRGNIDLTACGRCGFAFNRSFDPGLADIGAQYESSQAASQHFNAFAAAIAQSWVARHTLQGKTVLEIGCGNGEFLATLVRAGVARGIGFDPLMNIERAAGHVPKQVQLIPRPFDAGALDVPADALVCRHTLEHVHDVNGFLTLVRQWAARAPGRVVLFDLPDAERVFAERAFWDIYYEHCNYFTATTLRRAFELAGFRILKLGREFQGQYLTVEAVADPNAGEGRRFDCSSDRSLHRSFAAAIPSSLRSCEEALARLKSSFHPLIIWQGNSKTVGFLSALAHPEIIDGAVDASPHRQGIFLPASGLPVYAPEMLKQLRPRHVILMNPAYYDEVAGSVRALALDLQLHPIGEFLT